MNIVKRWWARRVLKRNGVCPKHFRALSLTYLISPSECESCRSERWGKEARQLKDKSRKANTAVEWAKEVLGER
jgi:hypothetical protein